MIYPFWTEMEEKGLVKTMMTAASITLLEICAERGGKGQIKKDIASR
jgi:hypothetical protein